MKNSLKFSILFLIVLFVACNNRQPESAKEQKTEPVFPIGNIITGNNFTGTAWLHWLVPNDSIFNCPAGNVTFEPGARTNWHKHPGGQILLITGGQGYYQESGKQALLIKKGDVVLISPDVEHWHGATSISGFTHIAINTNVQKGSVVWLQPVSDEEYGNLDQEKQELIKR
jgi:quercetin dioxygenase-like cupin family protein